MRWYHYIAYFFGGAFLANTLPHLGNGISGHAFQSPFASPPGEGLSSSTVNVAWGLFNLVVSYLLVCRVGSFDLRKTKHVLVLGAGIALMSVMAARGFGRFHGGLLNRAESGSSKAQSQQVEPGTMPSRSAARRYRASSRSARVTACA